MAECGMRNAELTKKPTTPHSALHTPHSPFSSPCAGWRRSQRIGANFHAGPLMEESQMSEHEVATLAGGCFWCLEAAFQDLKGVENVQSGYAGGRVANPSYEDVCTGTTGHAEVVQITFDPQVVSFEDLLHVFFTI